MRTFLMLAIVLIITAISSTKAAVPQLINYQGVMADSTGAGLDTTVNITFSIYENAVGLTPIWVEAHASVIVTGGLFNVLLGSITPLDVSIFGGTIRYLGITVGADPEISPRIQLVSVPYSLRSQEADVSDLAILALHADTADFADTANFADTAALAVLALVAELAIFADSARVADELDSLSSEDFSRTGHSHGGGGASGWTDDGTVVRLDASADSVGIGTSTPSEKLDVVGNLIVSGKANIGPGNANAGLNAFVTGTSNSASGDYSTVGGGQNDTASGQYSTVSGGWLNTASGLRSTVSGGLQNTASDNLSTVGGGVGNTASSNFSTVSGGQGNTASGSRSTVGGGLFNDAIGHFATVSGGYSNDAVDTASFVGGGRNNKAHGKYSVVSGGGGQTAADSNSASGDYSAIGGGTRNTASGDYSAIGGGTRNTAAGHYSFAAGRRAKANHDGSFVWGDSFNGDVSSSASNQFTARASGGVRFFSNTALTTGVTLSAGGAAWATVSDSTVKRNIRLVDEFDILEKVARLPISRWSYETQSPDIEHIGPMSQDFYAAFGLGENEKGISTLDPDGVSLAAIKALYKKNKELNKRLEKLEKIIDELSKK